MLLTCWILVRVFFLGLNYRFVPLRTACLNEAVVQADGCARPRLNNRRVPRISDSTFDCPGQIEHNNHLKPSCIRSCHIPFLLMSQEPRRLQNLNFFRHYPTHIANSSLQRDHRRSGCLSTIRYQTYNLQFVDYCAAPDCQFNYGPACDANKIPAGTNTSSIPRTQLGSVLYGSSGIYDCVNPGDMALTFDDGPFIYTSHILDVLDQYNASATFFITGNNNGELSSTFHRPNNNSPFRKGPNRQHEFGLVRTHPVCIRSLLNRLY